MFLKTKQDNYWFVAFKGATMYEMQLGPFWITFLRPLFWRTSWPRMVRVGWDLDWNKD